MKVSYPLLAVLALWAIAPPQRAAAQEFTDCPDTENICVVEWGNAQGEPIINALRNTVANDDPRPPGRVYMLKRGGFYYNTEHISNTGFHLRLVGQSAQEGAASGENVCGAGGNEDCGPAVIQRFRRENGEFDGLMLQSSGEGGSGFTLKNVWIMGMDNTGATGNYEPISINSSNSRFVIDNVIFDRNDWHHLGFKAGGNSVFITNSHFRNLTGSTQIWEGRGVRFEAGADTVVFENNTFFNLTSFPFQSEAAPVDYFVFNHNTLVNFGRQFNAGAIWKEAYIANNILVNPFFQGESAAQYAERLATWTAQGRDPTKLDPYSGIFSVGVLPSQFGLETDRRIVLANNNWWRSPELDAIYAPLGIRGQPLVSDSTMKFFNLYEGMVLKSNLNQQPGLKTAPTTAEVYGQIGSFLNQWVNAAATPWTQVYWDPGRPAPGSDDYPTSVAWPLPEDFSYTNSALLTAGTDGLPLGDLNWFPQSKDTYLANRAAYLQAIEDMAGAPPEPPAVNLTLQGEAAVALDNATVQSVEGFTSFFIESGGSVKWTFEVPSEGTYGLNVMTNLRNENERGQHIRLDGMGLRNAAGFGEFFFCSMESTNTGCVLKITKNSWQTVQIRQADLIAEQSTALTLAAGLHTLELAPSWGYQGFAGVEVVDAGGTVVANLTPPTAEAVGVQEICPDGTPFCAAGFQWVDINAGGSLTWDVMVPAGINSAVFRIFYLASAGGTGTLSLDGADKGSLSFSTTGPDAAMEVASGRFNVTPGMHQVKLMSPSGGLSVDYAIMLGYEGAGTAVDNGTLPEGYALDQSYPNPARDRTMIRYTLGAPSQVTLTVYDVLGRRVATLAEGMQAAGTHDVQFDSAALASGTYFYRLGTEVGQQMRKMVVVK